MKMVNTYETKTKLSELLQSVQDGSGVVISKAGKPLGVLTVYKAKPIKRKPGTAKGKIIIKDDFDELPADFLAYFE